MTYKTLRSAIKEAEMLTMLEPNWFFYIFQSTSAPLFRIDNVGIIYSDEIILATYHKGQRV